MEAMQSPLNPEGLSADLSRVLSFLLQQELSQLLQH